MKTVGEILKKARLEKELTIEDISLSTKINPTYIDAIESNDFTKLPPSAFTKGFMQNYAKVVDLDPKVVLAIFRRDYDQDEKGRIVPRSLETPVKNPKINFSPTNISIVASVVISLIIVAFFVRQIINFNTAPDLSVEKPAENAQVTSPVEIFGQTHPEATVTVNNQTIKVETDGHFSSNLNLTLGEHTLVITAVSRNDKERTLQRIIQVVE